MSAVICRVTGATLVALVDTNDPECLEVRHCMNNTCDHHTLAGVAHIQSGSSGSDPSASNSEEDVLKLPFFLIPRSIGPQIAKRLLRHGRNSSAAGSNASEFEINMPSDVVAVNSPAQSMHCEQVAKSANGAVAGVKNDGSRQGKCIEGTDSEEGLVLGMHVWESGSVWDVENKKLSAEVGETHHSEGCSSHEKCMEAEECRELVAEVECTLVDLGLWANPAQ